MSQDTRPSADRIRQLVREMQQAEEAAEWVKNKNNELKDKGQPPRFRMGRGPVIRGIRPQGLDQ